MTRPYLSEVSHDEMITILDTISEAVFIDDALGNTLWINKACEKLYKVSRKDVVGKNVSDLEKEGIFSPSVSLMVMRDKQKVNLMHQNREGKRILSTGIPIFDEHENMIRIISTSRDISELVNLKNHLDDMNLALDDLPSSEQNAFFIPNSSDIIFQSSVMYNLLQLVKKLAPLDSTILITGESGSGKGIIAKFIHKNGPRKNSPFVKINCGAIPDALLESELFGYESGAFTGSRKEGKQGLFEVANHGTLFLDEISDLPLNLQVKLLQVIQDREIQRVGGLSNIPVDVRIISATNKNLSDLVRDGKFREDLFYRLNVVPIQVPPLRERHEDIIPLAMHFLSKINIKFSENKEISPEAGSVLLKYPWPGNVRELENIMERLVITTKDSLITAENLPGYLHGSSSMPQTPSTLAQAVELTEKQFLEKAAKEHKTTRKIAAALDISQPTVVRKLKKYGINV